MKVKHKIVSIHEDASPVDFEYATTIGPQDSIDLLQSPSGSDDLTPNLAVIQELEEIRNMIELKSRDLSKQEAILSQSLDRFHFDQVRALDAIKLKSDDWLQQAVELLERRFEKGALRVNKLLEKLDKRVKDLQNINEGIKVAGSRSADVPPLPDENSSLNPLEEMAVKLLIRRRVYRPPLERQFAYAFFSIILNPTLPELTRSQLLSIILEYLIGGVDALLNVRFMSIVEGFPSEAPLVESRFDRAKRGLVVKRLGLGESRSAPIDISLSSIEPPVKFDPELYLGDIRSAYNEAMSKTPKTLAVSTCFVSSLIDSGVAGLLRLSLGQQSKANSMEGVPLQYILVRVLLSSVKDVGDALRPLCIKAVMENSILSIHDFMSVVKVFVYIVDRLGGSLSESVASQMSLVLNNLIGIGISRSLTGLFLDWKQGIWWMIHFVSRTDLTDPENTVAMNIITLMEVIPSVSELIHPWRDSLLNMLDGINASDKCVVRIKMLLKLNSYS